MARRTSARSASPSRWARWARRDPDLHQRGRRQHPHERQRDAVSLFDQRLRPHGPGREGHGEPQRVQPRLHRTMSTCCSSVPTGRCCCCPMPAGGGNVTGLNLTFDDAGRLGAARRLVAHVGDVEAQRVRGRERRLRPARAGRAVRRPCRPSMAPTRTAPGASSVARRLHGIDRRAIAGGWSLDHHDLCSRLLHGMRRRGDRHSDDAASCTRPRPEARPRSRSS